MCCIMFPSTIHAFMYVMPVPNFQKGTFSCPSFVNTAVLAAFNRNPRFFPMWMCPKWNSVSGQVDVEQRRAWRHWSYISIFVFCWLFLFCIVFGIVGFQIGKMIIGRFLSVKKNWEPLGTACGTKPRHEKNRWRREPLADDRSRSLGLAPLFHRCWKHRWYLIAEFCFCIDKSPRRC